MVQKNIFLLKVGTIRTAVLGLLQITVNLNIQETQVDGSNVNHKKNPLEVFYGEGRDCCLIHTSISVQLNGKRLTAKHRDFHNFHMLYVRREHLGSYGWRYHLSGRDDYYGRNISS